MGVAGRIIGAIQGHTRSLDCSSIYAREMPSAFHAMVPHEHLSMIPDSAKP